MAIDNIKIVVNDKELTYTDTADIDNSENVPPPLDLDGDSKNNNEPVALIEINNGQIVKIDSSREFELKDTELKGVIPLRPSHEIKIRAIEEEEGNHWVVITDIEDFRNGPTLPPVSIETVKIPILSNSTEGKIVVSIKRNIKSDGKEELKLYVKKLLESASSINSEDDSTPDAEL